MRNIDDDDEWRPERDDIEMVRGIDKTAELARKKINYEFRAPLTSTNLMNPIYGLTDAFAEGNVPIIKQEEIGRRFLKAKRYRQENLTKLMSGAEVNAAKKIDIDPIYGDSFEQVRGVLSRLKKVEDRYDEYRRTNKGNKKILKINAWMKSINNAQREVLKTYAYYFEGPTKYLNLLSLKRINLKQTMKVSIPVTVKPEINVVDVIGTEVGLVGLYLDNLCKKVNLVSLTNGGVSGTFGTNNMLNYVMDFGSGFTDLKIDNVEITSLNPVRDEMTAEMYIEETTWEDEFQSLQLVKKNLAEDVVVGRRITFEWNKTVWHYLTLAYGFGGDEDVTNAVVRDDLWVRIVKTPTQINFGDVSYDALRIKTSNLKAESNIKWDDVRMIKPGTALDMIAGNRYVFENISGLKTTEKKKIGDNKTPYAQIVVSPVKTAATMISLRWKKKPTEFEMHFKVSYDLNFLKENLDYMDKSWYNVYSEHYLFDALSMIDYCVLSKKVNLAPEVTAMFKDLLFFSGDIRILKSLYNKLTKICREIINVSYTRATLKKIKKIAIDLIEVADVITILISDPIVTTGVLIKLTSIAAYFKMNRLVEFLKLDFMNIAKGFEGFVANPSNSNYLKLLSFATGYVKSMGLFAFKTVTVAQPDYIQELATIAKARMKRALLKTRMKYSVGKTGLTNIKDLITKQIGATFEKISELKNGVDKWNRQKENEPLTGNELKKLEVEKSKLLIAESMLASYRISMEYIISLIVKNETILLEDVYNNMSYGTEGVITDGIRSNEIRLTEIREPVPDAEMLPIVIPNVASEIVPALNLASDENDDIDIVDVSRNESTMTDVGQKDTLKLEQAIKESRVKKTQPLKIVLKGRKVLYGDKEYVFDKEWDDEVDELLTENPGYAVDRTGFNNAKKALLRKWVARKEGQEKNRGGKK